MTPAEAVRTLGPVICVLGLAAVVLVHEVAEVIVILNGLRAAQAKR